MTTRQLTASLITSLTGYHSDFEYKILQELMQELKNIHNYGKDI